MSLRDKFLGVVLSDRNPRPQIENDKVTCAVLHREHPGIDWKFQTYTVSKSIGLISAFQTLRQSRDYLGYPKFECIAVIAETYDRDGTIERVKATPAFQKYLDDTRPDNDVVLHYVDEVQPVTKPSVPEIPPPQRKTVLANPFKAPVGPVTTRATVEAAVKISPPARKTMIISPPERKVIHA